MCYPSVATIANAAGVSERTVRRALSEMDEAGLINIVPADDNPTSRRIELLWLQAGFRRPIDRAGEAPARLTGRTKVVTRTDKESDLLTWTPCPQPPDKVSAEESYLKKPSEETTTTNPTAAPACAADMVGSLSSSFIASQGNSKDTNSAELSPVISKAQAIFGAEAAERIAGCVRAAALEYSAAWVTEALEIGAEKGKGWGYVLAVLKNWKSQGCPSLRTTASKPARTEEGTNSADDRKGVPDADVVREIVARTLALWRTANGDDEALNDYYRLKMSCCAEAHIQRHGAAWDLEERGSFRRNVRAATEEVLDESTLARQRASLVSQLRCG
jgi:hypothetical protein